MFVREVREREDIKEKILLRSRWEKDAKMNLTELESEGLD
jgi:hypothetical protein